MQFFRSPMRAGARGKSVAAAAFLSLVLIGGAFQFLGYGPVAQAAPAAPPAAKIGGAPVTISGDVGGKASVVGTTFKAGETVRMFARTSSNHTARARVDSGGQVRFEFRLPEGYVGAISVVLSSNNQVRTGTVFEMTGLLDRSGEKRVADTTAPNAADLQARYKRLDEQIAVMMSRLNQAGTQLDNPSQLKKGDVPKIAKFYERAAAIRVAQYNTENQSLTASLFKPPAAGSDQAAAAADATKRKTVLIASQIVAVDKMLADLGRLLAAPLTNTAPV